ncbi:MAG: cofactor-independent phosphoglycerate mutase [Candidatus Altiarchaeota archaeon]|nr:cofactor-independent phosphoglycerate mutase [Candidatus Altiarchaeota archaeon]
MVKYVLLLCDGMSDRPLKELSGRTPLEAANKPNMDYIAREGRCGLAQTLHPGVPFDSGVANLCVLGYDPRKYYPGRGPLEAMNMGVKLSGKDIALRCNIIFQKGGRIADFTSGHISNGEGSELMNAMGERFGGSGIELYPGVSYRNLIVLRERYSDRLDCKPPHDIVGGVVEENLIKPLKPDAAETAKVLNDIMRESVDLLSKHPVNVKRVGSGKNPGNMLWFWGPGRNPKLEKFESKYGLSGSLISAVDLLKGIARVIGLEVIDVPGATGYLDTNYEGKADYALKSLESKDFVYVHIESTDESGHEGSLEHKIKAIEDIDERVLGRMLNKLEGDYVLGLLPDHATPIEVRTHVDDPVPFAIYDKRKKPDKTRSYSEKEAKKGAYGLIEGHEFMSRMFG